ncbi:hypothetical protein BCR39DRAFT_550753 [Naematelia encephala]|uniref:Uncharacterized protein n=1 Tax=Naematelia encephala TaxID=71784 RepID=A0A1Y2AJU5_9TREE|nr:hypothetical protein BCR39DRAFT_550753 [Naematelia encephala]
MHTCGKYRVIHTYIASRCFTTSDSRVPGHVLTHPAPLLSRLECVPTQLLLVPRPGTRPYSAPPSPSPGAGPYSAPSPSPGARPHPAPPCPSPGARPSSSTPPSLPSCVRSSA